MSMPMLTEMLPATLGGRHIALELPWPGHGKVRVWLTPDRDLAVDAVAIVSLLEISEPSTYELHPVTWIHQWTPPVTRMMVTAYLWSRDEAIRAASLAGDARIGDEFVLWLTDQYESISRYWEDTLDAALPQRTRGHVDARDIELRAAAERISEATGRKVTRAELFEQLQEIGWIFRPPSGAGWRPSLEARALDVVYSRTVALPGNAGPYEQCFLTDRGYRLLEEHVAALTTDREDQL